MSEKEETCDDCTKFRRPTWVKHDLGICREGMYGYCEASDPNDEICEHFKRKKDVK